MKKMGEYARAVLRDYYPQLLDWYNDALCGSEGIVAFVVRRGYCTALCMEMITDVEMKDTADKVFVTDAGLLNMARELAVHYAVTGSFPQILIVDDILLHGRNIEHIVDSLAKSVLNELDEIQVPLSRRSVIDELVKCISISVCGMVDTGISLNPAYLARVRAQAVMPVKNVRELSVGISAMVDHFDVTNSCYVLSESLSEDDMEKIERFSGDFLIKTRYAMNSEAAWVKPLVVGNEIVAVFAVRVKSSCDGKGRAMPFVFLPNLDGKNTKRMESVVLKDLGESDISHIGKSASKGQFRAYCEYLTLYLSQVALSEFNRRFGLREGLPCVDSDEVVKVARNMRRSMSRVDDTESLIQRLCMSAAKRDFMEMESSLAAAISGYGVGYVSKDARFVEKETIVNKLEKLFYGLAYNDEYYAYNKPGLTHERKEIGWIFGRFIAVYQLDLDSVKVFVAYLLQMIDTGVLSVSSVAANRSKVTGFVQYAKAGEMSLAIPTLKCYRYIYMLVRLCGICRNERMNYRKVVEGCFRYFDGKGRKGRGDSVPIYSEQDKDNVLRFIDDVDSYGQTPKDWLGNYFVRMDNIKDIQAMRDFTEDQLEIADECSSYARSGRALM